MSRTYRFVPAYNMESLEEKYEFIGLFRRDKTANSGMSLVYDSYGWDHWEKSWKRVYKKWKSKCRRQKTRLGIHKYLTYEEENFRQLYSFNKWEN